MKKISNNNEEDSSLSNVITMDGGKINNIADGLNKSSSMEINSNFNNEKAKIQILKNQRDVEEKILNFESLIIIVRSKSSL